MTPAATAALARFAYSTGSGLTASLRPLAQLPEHLSQVSVVGSVQRHSRHRLLQDPARLAELAVALVEAGQLADRGAPARIDLQGVPQSVQLAVVVVPPLADQCQVEPDPRQEREVGRRPASKLLGLVQAVHTG